MLDKTMAKHAREPRKRAIKRSVGEHIFDFLNIIILGALALSMLYPFWYLFAVSLADAERIALSKVFFWPGALSLESYRNVLSSVYIYYGFFWSVTRTVLGTAIALFLGYNFA